MTGVQTQGTVVNISLPSASRKKMSHEMPCDDNEDLFSNMSLARRANPSQDTNSFVASKDAMIDHDASGSADTNISGLFQQVVQ